MRASELKHFLKLSKVSLFAGIFLTSCLGSKFLTEDEQILARQDIRGISGSLKDGSSLLVRDKKNTRFIGLPFTHLAHFYELGKNGVSVGPNIERRKMRLADKKEILNRKIRATKNPRKSIQYQQKLKLIVKKKTEKIAEKSNQKKWVIIPGFDREKAIQKEKKISRSFNSKIEKAGTEKKINRLRAKRAKKLDKKRRKIDQGNQIMRWGEPIAIYDHNAARLAADDIRKFLNSKGYFNAKVSIDTASADSVKGLKGFGMNLRNNVSRIAGAKHRYINLDFIVERNSRAFVDSIQYDIEDPLLAELIFEKNTNSPLEKGFYDQVHLTNERDYINNIAINNGYYAFSKQYISFQVDSTSLGKDSLIIKEIIKNPENRDHHKVFYIDSIVFVAEANVNQGVRRTQDSFQDITFSFRKKRYPKRILGWRIPLEQDDRYSREQTIETQRQLTLLDNFRFVNINYDTLDNLFIANIFTSPFDKYQTSSEFGLSSSQGNPGPFININLKNRNTFNLLEIVSLDLNAKLQDLSPTRSDISNDFTGVYTSRQFGGELAVSFPQFMFPIGSKYQNRIGKYNPNTRVSFGVDYEDRINEYERLRYSGALAYGWQIRDRTKYTITPARVSWIDVQNSADFQIFIDTLILERNPFANAFRPAIVTSSSFERNQNFGDYGSGGDGAYLRTYFEIGGHFNSLVPDSFFGDQLEEFEYIKANIDLRRINRLSSKYRLAYRLNLGYAYPFGENRGLPFDGYFYAGGSSSIRGWRPRRLGPGSYVTFLQDRDGNFTDQIDDEVEQPGEILIESSIELRRDLVGFMEGALFIDAGNIWRVENTSGDPEFERAVFNFDTFLSQIAVASGVGLRFDLQFLILRLDLGIKVVDPARSRGNRFILQELFKDFNNNSEINIGIGYPF